MTPKTQILDALRAFVRQRSGLDWRDYATATDYRRDQRAVSKYKAPCLYLINCVAEDDSITSAHIIAIARDSFSGRLTWDDDLKRWDYCTGQYFPTEYRRAAFRLLANLTPAYASHPSYKNL